MDKPQSDKAGIGRTAIVAMFMGILLTVGLVFCGYLRASEGLYLVFAGGITTLALGKAAQSTVEALATGTGLPGIKRTLMSDAKPGQPESTTTTVEEKVQTTNDAAK